MLSTIVLTAVLILEPGATSQEYRAEAEKMFIAEEELWQADSLLAEWKRAYPDDPERYIVEANVYGLRAGPSMDRIREYASRWPGASLVRDPSDSSRVAIEDSSGQIVSVLPDSVLHDPRMRTKAIATLTEAVRRFPRRLDIRLGLATAMEQEEDPTPAIPILRETARYSARYPDSLLWSNGEPLSWDPVEFVPRALADHAERCGKQKTPEGLRCWKEITEAALAFYPDSRRALHELGSYYATTEAWDKALPVFVRLAGLDSSDPSALLNAGHVSRASKQPDRARAFYESAMHRATDDETRNRIVGHLQSLEEDVAADDRLESPPPEDLQHRAEEGDPSAQTWLGWTYEKGENAEPDTLQAIAWYRKAAEQGDGRAAFALGWHYAHGAGVELDSAQALTWYRRGAAAGSRKAQYTLASWLDGGTGVPRDEALASQWFSKSADQGDARAQHRLAWGYEHGRGLPVDSVRAAGLYLRAAVQGHVEAQFDLCRYYFHGPGLEKSDSLAVYWCRRAALQGHPGAQYNLGWFLAEGRLLPLNNEEAAQWFRKAADQGNADAQFQLGVAYAQGEGVAVDERVAAEWYKKAASQGQVMAQVMLAMAYTSGRGVPVEPTTGLAWAMVAARSGELAAREVLGLFGRGVSDGDRARAQAMADSLARSLERGE